MDLTRRTIAGLIAGAPFAAARATARESTGTIPNEPAKAEGVRLPAELIDEALRFPAAITRGPADADVSVIVFTDANCPWCRSAYPALERLAAADRRLQMVAIDWPVLGIASIQAAKVGYGVLQLAGPAIYARFIAATMAAKGTVDGRRALQLGVDLGLARAALETRADGARSGALARQAVEVGANLGFAVTPSYVVHDHGFSGALPTEQLRTLIASVRRCESVSC